MIDPGVVCSARYTYHLDCLPCGGDHRSIVAHMPESVRAELPSLVPITLADLPNGILPPGYSPDPYKLQYHTVYDRITKKKVGNVYCRWISRRFSTISYISR